MKSLRKIFYSSCILAKHIIDIMNNGTLSFRVLMSLESSKLFGRLLYRVQRKIES